MTATGGEAYIRCLRVSELSHPHVAASERRRCAACDAEVWLDPALVGEIQQQHPDYDIVIHCRSCPVPIEDGEEADVEFSPGQVRRLREQGASDDEIAELFALAKIGGASGDLDVTRQRMAAALPGRDERHAFKRALVQARIFVALTQQEDRS